MEKDFQKAVKDKVVGLELSDVQKLEFDKLDSIIKKLQSRVKFNNCDVRYIYLLPLETINYLLKGKEFINSWKRRCKIDNIYKDKNNFYMADVSWKNKNWEMSLKTIFNDCKLLVPNWFKNKYIDKMDATKCQERINALQLKKKNYEDKYNSLINKSNSTIAGEVTKHPNEMVVSREAVRSAIKNIKRDSMEVATAWNSTLSKEEQSTLLNWLAKNIYSMRLYVVKDSSWDKAITELYPEEQYGSPRRTIPSSASKDSINGYISINSMDDSVPYDILKKITHKKNESDIIKYNGANKYRINNYMLVLFLLNEYNNIGFKMGVTNLNKQIKLS